MKEYGWWAREHTRLVEDVVLFTSNNVTILHSVYKCSKWQPSACVHSLAHFSAPTKMGRLLIVLAVYVMACVGKNVF